MRFRLENGSVQEMDMDTYLTGVVLAEMPENCTAVGIPARVVKKEGVRVEDELDQIHIPDPVAQEIRRLEEMLTALENELASLKDHQK